MRQIDERGVSALLAERIEGWRARGVHLHVSFDVDFLDPAVAPGTGTVVPGGATYREAHLVMEMLCDSGLVGSVDVVELNPFLDERGRTAVDRHRAGGEPLRPHRARPPAGRRRGRLTCLERRACSIPPD